MGSAIMKQVLMATCVAVMLSACVSAGPGQPGIMIETATQGQPLEGATCVATIGSVRWDVKTPAVIAIDGARGDLRIVCDKAGFRTSELIFKPEPGAGTTFSAGVAGGSYGGGGSLGMSFPLGGFSGRYPKRLVLDMNQA